MDNATSEDPQAVHLLLEQNIRTELAAQNALGSYGIPEEVLDNLAWAVTASVEYAFRVEWDPDWEPRGA